MSAQARRATAPKIFAIVLAGGRGSRLHDLTEQQSKPAIPFGGMARLIDFPLSNCYNSGIRQIAVATQYCSADLSRHVQSAWSFLSRPHGEFIDLWPAHQREGEASGWYEGTADAVFQNIDLLTKHAPDYVLILAGDHVYKQDYRILIDDHIRNGADMTVSCLEVDREDARGFGCVAADASGRITGFVEKPSEPPSIPGEPDKSFASMGIYVFSFEFLVQALRADQRDPSSRHDFGRNIIPAWYSRRKAYAHRFTDSCVSQDGRAYWKDVGTIDAFWQAHMDLLQPQAPIDLFSGEWPIWTEQTGRGPTRFLRDAAGRDGTATNSIIAPGCTIIGARIKDSVICQDVTIGSGSIFERCVVLPGAEIEEHCFYRDAIIGPGTIIPSFSSLSEEGRPASLRVHRSPSGKALITQRASYSISRTDPRVPQPIAPFTINGQRSLKLAAGD